MSTKIVLSIPQHAAENIRKDPQAFLDHMKAQGFPIESVSVESVEEMNARVQKILDQLRPEVEKVISPIDDWFELPNAHPRFGGRSPIQAIRDGEENLIWETIIELSK